MRKRLITKRNSTQHEAILQPKDSFCPIQTCNKHTLLLVDWRSHTKKQAKRKLHPFINPHNGHSGKKKKIPNLPRIRIEPVPLLCCQAPGGVVQISVLANSYILPTTLHEAFHCFVDSRLRAARRKLYTSLRARAETRFHLCLEGVRCLGLG